MQLEGHCFHMLKTYAREDCKKDKLKSDCRALALIYHAGLEVPVVSRFNPKLLLVNMEVEIDSIALQLFWSQQKEKSTLEYESICTHWGTTGSEVTKIDLESGVNAKFSSQITPLYTRNLQVRVQSACVRHLKCERVNILHESLHSDILSQWQEVMNLDGGSVNGSVYWKDGNQSLERMEAQMTYGECATMNDDIHDGHEHISGQVYKGNWFSNSIRRSQPKGLEGNILREKIFQRPNYGLRNALHQTREQFEAWKDVFGQTTSDFVREDSSNNSEFTYDHSVKWCCENPFLIHSRKGFGYYSINLYKCTLS